jgi:hypothetical protein
MAAKTTWAPESTSECPAACCIQPKPDVYKRMTQIKQMRSAIMGAIKRGPPTCSCFWSNLQSLFYCLVQVSTPPLLIKHRGIAQTFGKRVSLFSGKQ